MSRLVPSTTALLVVDVQERLAPAMEPSAFARLVRGTGLLLEAARLLGAPVIATEQYPKGLGPTIEPLLAPLEAVSAERLPKTEFSARGTIASWLEKVAPRAVVVVGVETHVCVYQTVRDLVGLGHVVHVPHDAVASRRDDDRRVGLDLMARAGATITTTETIVFDWLGKAEGDAFKTLSKKMR